METNTNETTGQRLTTALRWIGSISVISSAVVFMLQGLNAISSFERFLSFGFLTATLATLGLIAGGKLKESKSARTFLGLAASATPVLFSQLGAMVYAAFEGVVSSSIPKALVITAPSLVAIGAAIVATVAVLTPILYIGFGAFFRARARQLVLLMFACSSVLLLPTRHADWTALLVFVQTIALVLYSVRSRKHPAGGTESMVAGLLPILPVIILIFRQSFYSTSFFYASSGFMLLAAFLYEILPSLEPTSRNNSRSRFLGTLAFGGSWITLSSGILQLLGWPEGFGMMITVYPAIIAVILSSVGRTVSQKNGFHYLAEFASFAVPTLAALQFWGLSAALIHLLVGFSVAAVGFSYREKLVFGNGIFTSCLGLAYYVVNSISLLYVMPWVSLAIVGTLIILAATWLETNRPMLGLWRVRFHQHFSATEKLNHEIKVQEN
ncbi:MAG: hypothetical protein ACXWC9_02495 [Pseudobdellovibrionaceae bacterium]